MIAALNPMPERLMPSHRHPREYEYEAEYRAYLFGQFRLYRGQRRLDEYMPSRKKARLILIWFIINPGRPSSMEQFIDLFWPDSSPVKAVGNFHVAIHCLRRMLEPHLLAGQESSFIRRRPNNFYHFQVDNRWWTDAGDLEMLFERGQSCDSRGDWRRACFYYQRVAAYGAQGFLPDGEYGDWLNAHRQRYEQIYAQVLMRLMKLYAGSDDREELLEYAYQMLRLDRRNIPATRAIVDSYLRAGDVGRAQRRLKLFVESLPDDIQEALNLEFGELNSRIRAVIAGG